MTTPPPVPYVFDLDGGRPCLDFANTLSSSGEHLLAYADLLAFATQALLITPADADRLHAQASLNPRAADQVLLRARRLRDALRGVFSQVAADRLPADSDLAILNDDLAASLSHARVVVDRQGTFAWGWTTLALDTPIWPVTRSAADMLLSEQERGLVRECGADDCQWLFVDTTRNRSRQWCSMQSCGNREKARRHYQRLKARRATDA